MRKTVDIVIPCYNEEEALPLYFKAVDPVLSGIEDYQVGFVLVDDGSKDKTAEVMEKLYQERNDVTVIRESRNYGQNAAFTAGLKASRADYVILMDVDLQDPVELIPQILAKFSEGYDVVNPHRASRKQDSFFKRTTARMFYSFINKIEGKAVLPENVNCFRGLSRPIVDRLLSLPESDRFLINEIPYLGGKTVFIDFVRQKRDAGKSKYSVPKLFRHAFNVISSGTSEPLYTLLMASVGANLCTGTSFLVLLVLWILGLCHVRPFIGNVFTGIQTAFLVSAVFYAASFILLAVGVLALYEHNIVLNTRNRPATILDSIRRPEDKKSDGPKD